MALTSRRRLLDEHNYATLQKYSDCISKSETPSLTLKSNVFNSFKELTGLDGHLLPKSEFNKLLQDVFLLRGSSVDCSYTSIQSFIRESHNAYSSWIRQSRRLLLFTRKKPPVPTATGSSAAAGPTASVSSATGSSATVDPTGRSHRPFAPSAPLPRCCRDFCVDIFVEHVDIRVDIFVEHVDIRVDISSEDVDICVDICVDILVV